VAHEAAALVPGWNPCANFARGAKAPALMAVTSRLDEATGTVTLSHPDLADFAFRPDDPDDLPAFLDWVAPLAPPGRAAPARIVSAGRGMTDSDFPSVSILSLTSLADLSTRIGHDLSPDRWRGNLWIDGLEPWVEWDWVGRSLQIGPAELQIRERITRCRATSADPTTGRIDVDTLAGLRTSYGHEDFGLYALVTRGGMIRPGDPVGVVP
jgi:uncharacterized protein YcbX